MSELAITGGPASRSVGKYWPEWPPQSEKALELVTEVVKSGKWAYDGIKEWEFANIFAEFSGAKYCVPVANGTIAIQLVLEALDIGAYDEVIVPGQTWQATAAACIDVNAIPILVDVDPETFCLDLTKVKEAINGKTRAIIAVHLYGSMTNMDELLLLAKKHNIYVIEDCSHQPGSQWKGKGVGTLGIAGTFSLQLSKVLTSGEGGICVTDDWDLFQKLYSLRNCGRPYREGSPALQSGNYRMTDLQAALLIAQMDNLEAMVLKRDKNAKYLNAELAKIPGICPLKRHPEVNRQSYYSYGFRYDSGKWNGIPGPVFRQAFEAEIGLAVVSTYEPLNNSSLYKPHTKKRHNLNDNYWKSIDPTRFDLPVCRNLYEESAVLILHPFLLAEQSDMDDIIHAVLKLYKNREELFEFSKKSSK